MKRSRKGFTLVELLIVVTILGTLAAMMTLSSTTATASARAAAIVNGLRTAKSAAALFYTDYPDKRDSWKTDFATDGKEYFDETANADWDNYVFIASPDTTPDAGSSTIVEWYIGYKIQGSEGNVKSRLAGLAAKNKLYGGTAAAIDVDDTKAPKAYATTDAAKSAVVYMRVH